MDLLMGLDKAEAKQPSEHVEELAPTPEDEALNEFFDAHEKGDRAGAREAFKSAVRICMMSQDYDNEKEAETP